MGGMGWSEAVGWVAPRHLRGFEVDCAGALHLE